MNNGISEWTYRPATDLEQEWSERLQGFPREPHMWMFLLRSIAALTIRAWLTVYHRVEIRGREDLPSSGSFIVIANHQSHLDTMSLSASLPLKKLHRVFPAAATDYFFSSLAKSVIASVVANALPFDREVDGAKSLAICRRLLETPGNILIIFPEGTRSSTGELGRFRSGIGRLVEGTDIPVVPCHIQGAHAAFPKGAWFPRPQKLVLTLGPARSFESLPPGRGTVERICVSLHRAVKELGR